MILIGLAPQLFSQTSNPNIEVYIKVWGFLKYHHPTVATGKINWDSVFMAHINKARYARSITQYNDEIEATINAAGIFKKVNPVKLPADVFTANHNLKWLYTSKLLSKKNRERLQVIFDNRNQGDNRFIKFNNYSDYSGENQYENMSRPTTEYRLLFLARFWNAINYFDPYKYLIGEDWDIILGRFIPRIVHVTDVKSYYKTLSRLSKSLNDGHSSLTLNYRSDTIFASIYGRLTAPFYCKIIDDRLLIKKLANDSLCKLGGIIKGDEIFAVENKPVELWLQPRRDFISSSNKNSENEVLSWFALDNNATNVNLTIKRGDRFFKTMLKRMPVKQKNWNDIIGHSENNTGYETIGKTGLLIYASQITDKNLDTLRKMIMKSKAVIFDVRNYPGQDAFYNILGILLPEPKIINYNTFFMTDNPGIFKWKPSPKIGDVNPAFYKGKVVILVDERSQSQGEYSAMVLQTIPNSITIGSQTAGADGVVSYIPMGGKLAISYSGYGIYYPNKAQTQRVGVKIDIPIKKTVASVIKDQDLILQEALKYLKINGID